MLVATQVQAECYEARWSNGRWFQSFTSVLGEEFAGSYPSRALAVRHAKNYGLCVRNYGIEITSIDQSSNEAIRWKMIEGYSVWDR
jgi:hypothetical protein